MLGVLAGDEDPLPPNGGNPHPVPMVIDDFHMWHATHEGEPMAAEADAALNAANAQPHVEEPVLRTPPQSPIHEAPDVADQVALGLVDL